jgi:hypothetical protein
LAFFLNNVNLAEKSSLSATMPERPNLPRRAAAEAIGALAYQLVRGEHQPGRRAENRSISPEIGPSTSAEG